LLKEQQAFCGAALHPHPTAHDSSARQLAVRCDLASDNHSELRVRNDSRRLCECFQLRLLLGFACFCASSSA